MSHRWNSPATVLIVVATCVGCSSWSNRASHVSGDALRSDSASSTSTTEALRTDEVEEPCDDNNVASLTKSFPPADGPATGPTIDKIKNRGALIVGVDETTLLLSYRDPGSSDLEGFEIDLARAIARDLLG